MKKINIFVLILINTISTLILGGCTSYSNVNERDLRFRGDNIYDLVYLKNSNTPYTGKVSSFYENGDKKKTENYRKGKLHQLSIGWHNNGQIAWKSYFERGKRNGPHKEWHNNGQLKIKTTYKNDQINGHFESWHQNGEVFEKGNYLYNKKIGTWKRMGESGEYLYEEEFVNGEKIRGSWSFKTKG